MEDSTEEKNGVEMNSAPTESELKPSCRKFSFKQSIAAIDSECQKKITRAASQSTQKVSPADIFLYERMCKSEPRFSQRVSTHDLPHGASFVPFSSVQWDAKATGGSRTSLGKMNWLARKAAYQCRSRSTESPGPHSSKLESQ